MFPELCSLLLGLSLSLWQGLPIVGEYALAPGHRRRYRTPILGLHLPPPPPDCPRPHPQLTSAGFDTQGTSHKAKIKVSVKLDYHAEIQGQGRGKRGTPSKFTQVTGKIQFLAVTDLMSLIASWRPAGMHFLLPEAPWTPSHRSSSIITPECQIPLLPHQMSMGFLFSNS